MTRKNGYAPLRDYAAIGDGRTVALVSRDGAIDWLALPTVASVPVFARLLDAERGGSFTVEPMGAYEVERRYLPHSNVLETTFRNDDGAVRITDAVTMLDGGLLPWFELARRIECLRGRVRLRYAVDPRFPLSDAEVVAGSEDGTPTWRCRDTELALLAFGTTAERAGQFELREGESALLALVSVQSEPIPRPERDEIETRIEGTVGSWKRWIHEHDYEGPWDDAVERAALALKLLVYAPKGGIVAAPTTSLPESIGGDANWDYRFAWVRDMSYTLDALLALGRREQAHASFAWLLDAVAKTAPDIRPLYPLVDSPSLDEREVDLDGYRGSRPVRVGNAAWRQTQLGVYGDLLDTAWRYVAEGNTLTENARSLLVDVLQGLASRWRSKDSGFWEIRSAEQHYTHSKLSVQIAYDRALRLAQQGELSGEHAPEWARALDEVQSYVESHCWSPKLGAYRFYVGEDKLDTTALLACRRTIPHQADERIESTIEAIRRELSAGGPLLYRHSDAVGNEGAFVASSFWLVDALAHADRVDEAAALMDDMLALANDVGLYSEEIDPQSRELLGNFPQGLSLLSLIQAATSVAEVTSRSSDRDRASARRRLG